MHLLAETGVGQRFGDSHADAGTKRRGDADHQGGVRVARHRRGEDRGQGRDGPVDHPHEAGLDDAQYERRLVIKASQPRDGLAESATGLRPIRGAYAHTATIASELE